MTAASPATTAGGARRYQREPGDPVRVTGGVLECDVRAGGVRQEVAGTEAEMVLQRANIVCQIVAG